MNLAAKGALLLALFALPTWAQVRGIPASATSVTRLRGFNNNIPASVTSLGPLGFSAGRHDGHGFRFVDRLNRRRFGFFPVGIPLPLYVVADEPEPVSEVVREVASDPQRIEITVVDKRETREPSAASSAKPEPRPEPPPEPELSPTIVILQDGTRKELRNYAIMGKVLFDLADNRMFRIPLETVNLDATVAANAAQGKQFRWE
jgi:hypothetical protein